MSTRKNELESASDHAWSNLAEGSLSREEEAVLRALADEGEIAAVHYEAYAPLDEAFHARTSERIEARLSAERRRRKVRYLGGATGIALAAAAAFALFVVPEQSRFARYALEVQGGAATLRGGVDSGPVKYDQNSVITLIARPRQRVEGPVVASLVRIVEGQPRPVRAHIEVAQSGAVRVAVAGKDLPTSSKAPFLLVLVIDREARGPREIMELERARDPRVLPVMVVPSYGTSR